MSEYFTVTVFFTDNSAAKRRFKKVESAKLWLHAEVGFIEKSIHHVESTGPTLAELEVQPVILVESVAETMPEPSFEAAGDGLSWMESSDRDVERALEDPDERVRRNEDALRRTPALFADPDLALPDSSPAVLPAPVPPVVAEQAPPKPAPVTKVPCPKCSSMGYVEFKSGGTGRCYRCAADYKDEPSRGFQTAEDLRRNRTYDLVRSPEKLKVRFETNGRLFFQDFAPTTEVFVPEKGAALARQIKPGDVILVASARADDEVLHEAKVVEVVAAR
jgi:hypothetical protein